MIDVFFPHFLFSNIPVSEEFPEAKVSQNERPLSSEVSRFMASVSNQIKKKYPGLEVEKKYGLPV
jgi:hypothetical protein